MAVARRAVAPPPAPVGVNFGSLNFYAGGFMLPKGRYALEFNVLMHAFTKQDGTASGSPKLGVMVTAYSLDNPKTDPQEQFLSMGSKADASFAPTPDGKGVQAVPGGVASTLPRNTNWNLFLKSLYDSGLPEGIFTNDMGVLDGVWVQTDQVPEPEERKSYASARTGEAADEPQSQGPKLVPVVVEILEGGKPWEGTGGIPAADAAPAPAARPVAARPVAARPAARPAPAPVAAAADDDDVMTAAVNGVTAVLEAEPNGTTKLKLRTGTFKAVSAAGGAEMAQAVLDTFFGNDEALNSVLGQLGYSVQGQAVKPA